MSFWDDFTTWLRSLFGSSANPEPVGQAPQPVTRKVTLIIFDPPVPGQGGQALSRVLGWNDTAGLVNDYIADLQASSHGYLNYQIVETIHSPTFPVKADGFLYDADAYLQYWQSGSGFHQPDMVDYPLILEDFNLVQKVNSGATDEVWLVAMPYAGFYESIMAGPGAFFCNAPALTGTSAARRFIIMGFTYQRGVGEMLESFGHRAESILRQVFRNASGEKNLWSRFTRYEQVAPGQAECGTVHFAPNSTRDYEWGNATFVQSRCRNWNTFPNLDGAPVSVNCVEWGNGDIRAHHNWWLGLFPHISGSANDIAYNWWKYIVDPNEVH